MIDTDASILPPPSSKMITSTAFANAVERLVASDNITYLDAILDFGERNAVEPEVLYSLIRKSPAIRTRLEIESMEMKRIVSSGTTGLVFA